MAIFRIQEIRKMSKDERSKKLSELRAELSKMKAMQAMGGSLENPSRIRLLRKTIAKFLTVNREEELGIERVKPSKEAPSKEAPKAAQIARGTREEAPKEKVTGLREKNIYEQEDLEEENE